MSFYDESDVFRLKRRAGRRIAREFAAPAQDPSPEHVILKGQTAHCINVALTREISNALLQSTKLLAWRVQSWAQWHDCLKTSRGNFLSRWEVAMKIITKFWSYIFQWFCWVQNLYQINECRYVLLIQRYTTIGIWWTRRFIRNTKNNYYSKFKI